MARNGNKYMGSKIRQKKKYFRSVWGIVLLTLNIALNLIQFVWASLLMGEEFTIGWGAPTCIGKLIWGPYITMILSVPTLLGIVLLYTIAPKYRTDEDVFKPNFVLSIVLVLLDLLCLVLIFW